MAFLRMLLCPLVLIGVLAGLQTQGVSASNDPNKELHQNDAIKKIDGRYTEHDEDLEDDGDVDLKLERSVARGEDQEYLDEVEEDLEEAGIVLRELQKQMMLRSIFNATINGTTVVFLNHEYCFQSHDTFGLENYPNDFERVWFFEMGPGVVSLKVHCEFFRVEWGSCCQYDKFVIFKWPYRRGVRHCGRKDGLWVIRYTDIKIRWVTDPIIQRAGFTCKVIGMPGCCGVIPVVPAVRQVVTTCADILPGYDYCQCDDLGAGEICLQCSICETCEMEFFAVHDFSQVDVYMYFDFPCDNCTMDLTDLTFGLNMRVLGHVDCLNPNPIVTEPTYPNSDITVLVFCPPPISVCPYFTTLINDPNGRKHSPALLDGEFPLETQKNAASLVIVTGYGDPNAPIDLSTISNAGNIIHLTINDTTCHLFSQNQEMDLTAFTQVEVITIYLCNTSVPCNSIIINSSSIVQVTIQVPNTADCDPTCIVNNLATPPPASPPAITC